MVNPGARTRPETRVHQLEGHQLLVLRGDFQEAAVERLVGMLREQSPTWTGPVVVLPIDQDISCLDEKTAQNVYQQVARWMARRLELMPVAAARNLYEQLALRLGIEVDAEPEGGDPERLTVDMHVGDPASSD